MKAFGYVIKLSKLISSGIMKSTINQVGEWELKYHDHIGHKIIILCCPSPNNGLCCDHQSYYLAISK